MRSKVLFFFEDRYAFGTIHHGLLKELYKHEILGEHLSWNVPYNQIEINSFRNHYKYIMTIPSVYGTLRDYGFDDKSIILSAHGEEDLIKAVATFGPSMFERIGGFCVVSELLVERAKEYGIKRIPWLTPVGINTKNFVQPISQGLNNIGYAAALSVRNVYNMEIKRGYLVEECSKLLNLPFVRPGLRHFLGMPDYYKTVDCMVMSSTEETVGLPIMEAAAAGRLVIGTEVGHFKTHRYGIKVPIHEKEFVEHTCYYIKYYQNRPEEYRKMCESIQNYALRTFDWAHKIQPWIDLLTS